VTSQVKTNIGHEKQAFWPGLPGFGNRQIWKNVLDSFGLNVD
jgi:hypothetical protein